MAKRQEGITVVHHNVSGISKTAVGFLQSIQSSGVEEEKEPTDNNREHRSKRKVNGNPEPNPDSICYLDNRNGE